MTEPAVAGQPLPRAFLRVAGASLAQHQLGLALALKCQRIVCIAREASPDILALQQVAEESGVQFYIASGPRQVATQVSSADDVFLITEGVFIDPGVAVPLLEHGRGAVLVQPVEGAQTAGYERIDLNRCTAGLARIPGALVGRLNELPEESDTISILTRIALQSQVEMREVPATARSGVHWCLVRSEADAIELEREWLHHQFAGPGVSSPGRALARSGALLFGSSLLQVGRASSLVSAAVLVLLAVAALLAWASFPVPGFLACALAWVLVEGGRRLRAAERRPLGELVPAIERADVLVWAVDFVLVCLVLSATVPLEGQMVLSWLYPPLSLFLLLALAPRILEPRLSAWATDRAVLAFLLAGAAVFGQELVVVEAIALLVLVAELVLVKRQ